MKRFQNGCTMPPWQFFYLSRYECTGIRNNSQHIYIYTCFLWFAAHHRPYYTQILLHLYLDQFFLSKSAIDKYTIFSTKYFLHKNCLKFGRFLLYQNLLKFREFLHERGLTENSITTKQIFISVHQTINQQNLSNIVPIILYTWKCKIQHVSQFM